MCLNLLRLLAGVYVCVCVYVFVAPFGRRARVCVFVFVCVVCARVCVCVCMYVRILYAWVCVCGMYVCACAHSSQKIAWVL